MDHEHQMLLDSAPPPEYLASIKVFPLIPSLKKDVFNTIDSALSWEQLTASDVNFSIVRPLVTKYARLQNMAVVYACLLVRSYFQAESATNLAYAGVMDSRAILCEILATKLLSRFASKYIQLVAVLTTRWNPLAGAPLEVVEQVKFVLGGDEDMNALQSALDTAISTQAKAFLASPLSQKVVNDIYFGRVIFTTSTSRSILADNYKPKAIEIYDSCAAPFIDHYRLRVPFYGNILEFINFSVLLLTFILCLSTRDNSQMTGWEMLFVLFACAFTLQEYTAAMEHGWIFYVASLWNVFDFSLITIFLTYLGLRIKSLVEGDAAISNIAFDILSCGACLLFPRLSFFAVSNNVIILSLRAMVSQFIFFIGIASVCFSGLLFTLWTLGQDSDRPHSFKSIAWLLTQIWFGNPSLGFHDAESFHPILGPILMIGFAAMSNTLLLTILISVLSNTVARISDNETQEYLVQSAILTMERVQSDALFSYQPPFNILAFLILKPATFFLSPRALHSVNVFLIKLTSLPILIVIGIYERYFAVGQKFRKSGIGATQSIFNSLQRHIKIIPLVEALIGSSSNGLYDAIFDVDIPSNMELFNDDSEDELASTFRSFRSRSNNNLQSPNTPTGKIRVRRPSSTRPPSPPLQSASRSRNISLTIEDPPQIVPSASGKSPLAKLFGPRRASTEAQAEASAARAEASAKRAEALYEGMRGIPVEEIRDGMKELQDRQARIENLLLKLTGVGRE